MDFEEQESTMVVNRETEQVCKEIIQDQSRTETVELHPRLLSFLERDSSFLTPWNWNAKEYLPFSPSYFNTHHYMKFQLGSFYLFNNDLVYLIHNKSDDLNLREQVLHPKTVTEIEQEGSEPEEADSQITHQDSQPEENIVQ